MATNAELAERWKKALEERDVASFRSQFDPDAPVWQSPKNDSHTAKSGLDGIEERGGLPEFRNIRMTVTDWGYICQTETTLGDNNVFLAQFLYIENDLIVREEEYISIEGQGINRH